MKNLKNEFSIEELQEREEFTTVLSEQESCKESCTTGPTFPTPDDILL